MQRKAKNSECVKNAALKHPVCTFVLHLHYTTDTKGSDRSPDSSCLGQALDYS